MIPSNKSEPSVLSQSKKISKCKLHPSRQSCKESQNSQEYLVMETGYDTFLREEKEEILLFLKKHILILKGLDASWLGSETGRKSPDWIKLLREVGAKSFNQLLKKVIPQYRPRLALSTKELTNLRKKIKGWFNSEGSSEKRGDPLIHDDELPRFKEVLREFMKVRNFEQLRKEVLPYVKEIRMQSSRKFVDSMFSKKFWSTFLNKEENRDIKTIWESLPSINGKIIPKKSVKGINQDVEEETASYTCESENELNQVEEDIRNDYAIPAERTQGGFWIEDEKMDRRDMQVDDCMEQIDYGELQKFFINTEEVSVPCEMNFRCSQQERQERQPLELAFRCSQQERQPLELAFRCSQDRQEERSKQDFIDDFWSDWHKRANGKEGFTLGLSQDSHKPAYFST